MILRLTTANENGRRRAWPIVGAALCGRPPELRAPTQGRPYGLRGELEFS